MVGVKCREIREKRKEEELETAHRGKGEGREEGNRGGGLEGTRAKLGGKEERWEWEVEDTGEAMTPSGGRLQHPNAPTLIPKSSQNRSN